MQTLQLRQILDEKTPISISGSIRMVFLCGLVPELESYRSGTLHFPVLNISGLCRSIVAATCPKIWKGGIIPDELFDSMNQRGIGYD
jgi:hypothetical protein